MRLLRRLLILVLAIPLIGLALLGGVLAWVQWGNGAAALGALAGRFVPGLVIEGLAVTLPRELRATRITLADEGGVWLEVTAPRIERAMARCCHPCRICLWAFGLTVWRLRKSPWLRAFSARAFGFRWKARQR